MFRDQSLLGTRTPRSRSWTRRVVRLLGFLALATVVSAASIYFYHRHYAPRFVVADLKGFLAQIGKDLQAGELDQPALDKRFARFEEMLDALPENAVVLTSDVVLRPKVTFPSPDDEPHLVFLTPGTPHHVETTRP